MNDRAMRFLTDWVSKNINAEAYEPEVDNSLRARVLAARCRADAAEDGLSPKDLDAAARDMIGGGADLTRFIANALESATDAEVHRRANKDG